MNAHDGGKGDAPRPFSVDMETFDKNFDMIFGKKDKTQPKLNIEVQATNDEQNITVTKTWEF